MLSVVILELQVHVPLVSLSFLFAQFYLCALKITPPKLNRRKKPGESGYVNVLKVNLGALALLLAGGYDYAGAEFVVAWRYSAQTGSSFDSSGIIKLGATAVRVSKIQTLRIES